MNPASAGFFLRRHWDCQLDAPRGAASSQKKPSTDRFNLEEAIEQRYHCSEYRVPSRRLLVCMQNRLLALTELSIKRRTWSKLVTKCWEFSSPCHLLLRHCPLPASSISLDKSLLRGQRNAHAVRQGGAMAYREPRTHALSSLQASRHDEKALFHTLTGRGSKRPRLACTRAAEH